MHLAQESMVLAMPETETFTNKIVLREMLLSKRGENRNGSPSLRRHYPDQVLRVLSQPAAIAESTPRTLSRFISGMQQS